MNFAYKFLQNCYLSLKVFIVVILLQEVELMIYLILFYNLHSIFLPIYFIDALMNFREFTPSCEGGNDVLIYLLLAPFVTGNGTFRSLYTTTYRFCLNVLNYSGEVYKIGLSKIISVLSSINLRYRGQSHSSRCACYFLFLYLNCLYCF